MLCVNFYSVAVYNSTVMEFWPLLLKQRIKLVLILKVRKLQDPTDSPFRIVYENVLVGGILPQRQ